MKKIIVFLYLCVLSTLESAAQTILSEPVPFFFDLTSNEIWSFSQDNDGFLWTATSDGIARWDGHRLKTIRNDGLHPRMLSSNQTTCVRDGGLYLWVSSRHGITLIDKKTNQTLLPEDDDVLKTVNIENILTTDSVVWLQSTENFVFKCSIDGKIIHKYDFRQIIGQKKNETVNVNSFYSDRSGTLWVLLGRAGLAKYNSFKDCFETVSLSEFADLFLMFQTSDGRYWVSSWEDGLYELDPLTGLLIRRDFVDAGMDSSKHTFFSMQQDDVYGYLWLLSFNGLHVCSISEDGLTPQDLSSVVEPYKMYTRIFKDREGNLWLSSYDDAFVVSFDRAPIQNYVFKVSGRDANLMDLGIDDDGIIWMEQDRMGLCRFDTKTNQLTVNVSPNEQSKKVLSKTGMQIVYAADSIRNSLKDFGIISLLDDCTPMMSLKDKDALWVVTNKKVIRYDLLKKGYCIYSTSDENIKVNIFRHHSATLDGKGGIWVGGHNGFIHIGREKDNSRLHWAYDPMVSDVTSFHDLSIDSTKTDRENLVLHPGAKDIVIHLSALKYGTGQQPRIAYRIDGLNDDWVYLSPESHDINCNFFKKGTYHLWLKHEYEPGKWSEGRMVMTIIQLPEWYQTWWAYTLYIFAALALVWLLLITPFRMSKLRQRIKELSQRHSRQQAIINRMPEPELRNDADEKFINTLIKEVEAHLDESDYDLSTLATTLGISKSTLNRRVKLLTEMTPSDFLFQARMKRAVQLLKESSISVSEIAYSVGFSDPKYFTRCFKKFFNCTPSNYKQQRKD